MIDDDPLIAQFACEPDHRFRGGAEWLKVRDLRSDVDVQADDLDARRRRKPAADGFRAVHRHPEFVGLETSGDVWMALRIDIRVHAKGHSSPGLPGSGQRVDALDLPFGLRIYGGDTEIDRLRQIGGRLADAGEDDLRRDESGPQRDVDFTPRVRVSAGAKRPQQPRNRHRRVRLQRVVEGMRVAREREIDGAIAFGDGRGAVNVERCAFGGREIGERHAVTRQRALLSKKPCHSRPPCYRTCDVLRATCHVRTCHVRTCHVRTCSRAHVPHLAPRIPRVLI